MYTHTHSSQIHKHPALILQQHISISVCIRRKYLSTFGLHLQTLVSVAITATSSLWRLCVLMKGPVEFTSCSLILFINYNSISIMMYTKIILQYRTPRWKPNPPFFHSYKGKGDFGFSVLNETILEVYIWCSRKCFSTLDTLQTCFMSARSLLTALQLNRWVASSHIMVCICICAAETIKILCVWYIKLDVSLLYWMSGDVCIRPQKAKRERKVFRLPEWWVWVCRGAWSRGFSYTADWVGLLFLPRGCSCLAGEM